MTSKAHPPPPPRKISVFLHIVYHSCYKSTLKPTLFSGWLYLDPGFQKLVYCGELHSQPTLVFKEPNTNNFIYFYNYYASVQGT